MELKRYNNADAFGELASEWNSLAKTCVHHTLFQTREWLSTWWACLGQGTLHILELRDNGTLIGIAPLFMPKADELAVVGYKEVTDYVDVMFAAGREEACWSAVASEINTLPWSTFNFYNIPEKSATLDHLPNLARQIGWLVTIGVEDVCPVISLPESFDLYLAGLDGKERRELVRKLRRAEEDAKITFSESANDLEKDVRDFIYLMKQSTFAKSDFMSDRMEHYFQTQARAMFDAGWLQLAFLELEGERAATYMNFAYESTVLVYNSGLDPAKFAQLSPGQVLIGKLIEHAISKKYTSFDFLQGNEAYKFKLGAKETVVKTIKVSRR